MQVEEKRLDYCATLNAQLDTIDLALIAIKIVLVDGPIKGSSVDWLNMVEDQDILGSLVIGLMIMEWYRDVKVIMDGECVKRMVLYIILNVRLDILMLLAVFVDQTLLIAIILDLMEVLISHVQKGLLLGTLFQWYVVVYNTMLAYATAGAVVVVVELVLFVGDLIQQDGLTVVWELQKMLKYAHKLFLIKFQVSEI